MRNTSLLLTAKGRSVEVNPPPQPRLHRTAALAGSLTASFHSGNEVSATGDSFVVVVAVFLP